jgi:nucleotide-binding universal stress UspA family protein
MSTAVRPGDAASAGPGEGGRYVIGVNGSSASTAALNWVLKRSLPDTAVHLVGVVETLDAMGAKVEAMDAALARAAESARTAGHEVTREVRAGRVPLVLAESVGEGDLLVIGSDKTGFTRGRLYGLRAVQVAAAVAGPLAVVPSVDLRLRSGVGVAAGDPASAERLARVGAREAWRRGCSLAIVHALPPTSDTTAHGDEILALAREAARAECPEVDVWTRVVHRRPADAILNLSRDRAMLIVGRSRSTGPLGLGETLHEVLLNSNAPTLVL